MNTGASFGSFIAPIVLPELAARFGWSAGLTSASVMIAAAIVTWLLVGRTLSRAASPA